MRKRIASLLLAAALCVSLTGCSDEQDSGNTTQHESTSATAQDTQPEQTESQPAETTTAETTTASTTETTTSPEESRPEEQQPEESYAALITAFDNEYLGLPQKDKVYIFSDNENTQEINGAVYHAVSCYDEYEGTLYYMCDFYISEDGTKVYRYYESSEEFVLLPESEGFPSLDPTTQTPEEIFAVANELYYMFAYPSLEVDWDVYFELDGYRYCLLTDERFDTMNELIEALDGYFNQQIVNSLMDTNQFRMGDDGRMYYRDSAWGSNIAYLGTEYELTSLTEDTAVFTAYSSFEYEAGLIEEKEFTYTAQKQYGVWRFTDFPDPMYGDIHSTSPTI